MTPEPHFRIRTLAAFVAIDPKDDSEGIVGFRMPTGEWMPAIGADEVRIQELRPQVEAIANATGQTIKLVRFSVREDVETIEPEGKAP